MEKGIKKRFDYFFCVCSNVDQNVEASLALELLQANKLGLIDSDLCEYYTHFSIKADEIRKLIAQANVAINKAGIAHDVVAKEVRNAAMAPYEEVDTKSLIKAMTRN